MQIATDDVIEEIKNHAELSYPNEACGLIVEVGSSVVYLACENKHTDPANNFKIGADSYADAEDAGKILAVVHSHPGEDAIPYPSQVDAIMMEESGLPWGIITWPFGEYMEHLPQTGQPLTGRDFLLGSNDCYGLVMAFYRQNGVTIKDFRKPYEWWLKGEDLYCDENCRAAGFEEVKDGSLQPGDVITMKIAAKVTNHSGIYYGDGLIVHHMEKCKSEVVPYIGSYMQSRTVKIWRHPDLPEDLKWNI